MSRHRGLLYIASLENLGNYPESTITVEWLSKSLDYMEFYLLSVGVISDIILMMFVFGALFNNFGHDILLFFVDPTDRLLVTSGFERGISSADAGADDEGKRSIRKGIYAPVDYFVRGMDVFDVPPITAPSDSFIYFMCAAKKAEAIASGQAMAGIVDPQVEFLAQLAELKGCVNAGVYSGAYGGPIGGPFGAAYGSIADGRYADFFAAFESGVFGGEGGEGGEGGAFGGEGVLGGGGPLAALLQAALMTNPGGAFDYAEGGAGHGALGGGGTFGALLQSAFSGADGGILAGAGGGAGGGLEAGAFGGAFAGAESGALVNAGGGAFGAIFEATFGSGAGGALVENLTEAASGGSAGAHGKAKDSITNVLLGISGLVTAILGDQAHTKALMRTDYGQIVEQYAAGGGNKTAAELVNFLDKMKKENINQDVVLKKLVNTDKKQAGKGIMKYQALERAEGARNLQARRKQKRMEELQKKKKQRPELVKRAFLKRGQGEVERIKRANPTHKRVRKQKNRERVFDFFELPE